MAVPASALAFDVPVMVAVCAACASVVFTGPSIARWEGVLFLGYYAAYTAYLIMDAGRYRALATYGRVMLWYVIPLTAVTLAALAVKERRAAGRRRKPKAERVETTGG